MSPITTHVLDTTRGRPAAGIGVTLEAQQDGQWRQLARGKTDGDGRLRTLLPAGAPLASGTYRLEFDTAGYFASPGVETFYPRIVIEFTIDAGEPHYHVPLLLSPFGYTTYRGT